MVWYLGTVVVRYSSVKAIIGKGLLCSLALAIGFIVTTIHLPTTPFLPSYNLWPSSSDAIHNTPVCIAQPEAEHVLLSLPPLRLAFLPSWLFSSSPPSSLALVEFQQRFSKHFPLNLSYSERKSYMSPFVSRLFDVLLWLPLNLDEPLVSGQPASRPHFQKNHIGVNKRGILLRQTLNGMLLTERHRNLTTAFIEVPDSQKGEQIARSEKPFELQQEVATQRLRLPNPCVSYTRKRAGSPTETLLRLLLPLSDEVH